MKSLMMALCASGLLLSACSKNDNPAPPPSDVTDLSATAGNREVRLQWTKQTNNTHDAYVLSYGPDGMVANIHKDSSGCTIKQLLNGTEYSFTLKAKDQQGNVSGGITVKATPVAPVPVLNRYTGDLVFASQAAVDAFDSKYDVIEGNVTISGADITNLSKLSNLDSITGKLEVYFCNALVNMNNLKALAYVGNTLYIRGNPLMKTLSGLDGITAVGKDFVILDCPELTSLDGVAALAEVKGSIYIGGEGWKEPVKVRANPKLTGYCALRKLITGNGLKGDYYVANNAANPSKTDIPNICK